MIDMKLAVSGAIQRSSTSDPSSGKISGKNKLHDREDGRRKILHLGDCSACWRMATGLQHGLVDVGRSLTALGLM